MRIMSWKIGKSKEMVEIPDVPKEYKVITDNAVLDLAECAERVMWVAEMLGNDIFEVETDKYKVIINKAKK